jgi:hypothetical protein
VDTNTIQRHSEPAPQHAALGWLRPYAFRFVGLYLFLYFFPFPLGATERFWDMDPFGLSTMWDGMWHRISPWVGYHLLAVADAYSNPSFTEGLDSDQWYQWIRMAGTAILALVGAIALFRLDVDGTWGKRLREILTHYLRYALGAAMLMYGLIKILLLQMPIEMNALSLATPIGEYDPMSLLWMFMGYAPLYQLFAGLSEFAAGVLLLFRRTMTLGALIAVGVMTNVFMLNLNYDVTVKINSFHLLAVSVVLLIPDMRRLVDVFLLNRPTESAPRVRIFEGRCMRRAAGAANVALILWILGMTVVTTISDRGLLDPPPPAHPLAGFWRVDCLMREDQGGQLVIECPATWWAINVGRTGGLSIWGSDYQSRQRWSAELVLWEPSDEKSGRVRIAPQPEQGGNSEPLVLAYTRPSPDRLELSGMVEGSRTVVTLRLMRTDEFPLMRTRLWWKQE